MIIQKQRDMEVTVENSKDEPGKKIITLYERDGYHSQTAYLTKKQAEKMAKALTKEVKK